MIVVTRPLLFLPFPLNAPLSPHSLLFLQHRNQTTRSFLFTSSRFALPFPRCCFPLSLSTSRCFPPLQRVSVALVVVVAGNIDPSLLLEPSSAPNLPHLSLPLLLSPLINPVALTCNPSIHYILNSHSPPRNKSTLSLLDLVFKIPTVCPFAYFRKRS